MAWFNWLRKSPPRRGTRMDRKSDDVALMAMLYGASGVDGRTRHDASEGGRGDPGSDHGADGGGADGGGGD
jgi:hypothetical protein